MTGNHPVWLVLPVLVVALGCTAMPPENNTPVDLVQAQVEIPEAQLLDVGIEVFDPGVDEEADPEETGVFPAMRQSEARYISIHLAETMQETGHWGAVRVLPAPGAVDLSVSGRILASDGVRLEVEVVARDATGRVWLEQRYKELADTRAYRAGKERLEYREPFQDLYNRIANDLVRARRRQDAEELEEIRRVAELRFATDLAPVAFADYLSVDRKGRYSVQRLPAPDDPMAQRIALIREREHLFVDTLNQHYAGFYNDMTVPYDSWRKFSFSEQVALEGLRRKAMTQKVLGALAVIGAAFINPGSGAEAAARDLAVYGGIAAISAGVATSKEARIHVEALEELSASFDAEVEPMVVEVEGQVLRLQGSAETQYGQWRDLLREIYATETGLPLDLNAEGVVQRPGGGAEDNTEGVVQREGGGAEDNTDGPSSSEGASGG